MPRPLSFTVVSGIHANLGQFCSLSLPGFFPSFLGLSTFRHPLDMSVPASGQLPNLHFFNSVSLHAIVLFYFTVPSS